MGQIPPSQPIRGPTSIMGDHPHEEAFGGCPSFPNTFPRVKEHWSMKWGFIGWFWRVLAWETQPPITLILHTMLEMDLRKKLPKREIFKNNIPIHHSSNIQQSRSIGQGLSHRPFISNPLRNHSKMRGAKSRSICPWSHLSFQNSVVEPSPKLVAIAMENSWCTGMESCSWNEA